LPRPGRRYRILLTEGSSLSARQTLYALGRSRHRIDVCDPRPFLCLGRYSRYVRACHRCPSFTADPAGYVHFLIDRLERERYDVLLPVHDQVYVVARFRDVLGRRAGLAVPDFTAVQRVQSKAAFVRLLDELGLPHPATVPVSTRQELEQVCDFPCYVKLPFSTAGCGVWLVRDRDDLQRVAGRIEQAGLLAGQSQVLVQQPAAGALCVVQSVFQQGRLVAGHCYQARALGVGGSAWARVSVAHPLVLEHLGIIGSRLGWHGALMLDYLYDPRTGQPAYIDANPRVGETLNATLSGVNLCEVLLHVALGHQVAPRAPARVGVQSHSVVMRLLAGAQRGENRRRLLAELGNAWMRRGLYAGSAEELTRPWEDPLSLFPAAVLAGQLLINPGSADRLIQRTVDNYALSEAAARIVGQLPN
jgi:predicted ATP-grasp superfamily ATP-dependent carboligase